MSAPASIMAEPLIDIARATLRDLREADVDSLPVSLESTLDQDLGLDSLARVELFARIEQELHVRLPDSLFESAETLSDIAAALDRKPAAAANEPRPTVDRRAATPLASAPPASLTTLNQVLCWNAEHHPPFPQLRILDDDREEIVTYESLLRDAQAIAGALQKHNVQAGEPVALMLPTSRDYFTTFFGVLLAGAIPVPLYPPSRLGQIEEHVHRHAGILTNANASMLVTTSEMRRVAALLRIHSPSLRKITTADELRTMRSPPATHGAPDENDIALLQYTSGSTGQPKGVMLTHANLLANIAALGGALEFGRAMSS